jgi:hypothetical protein
MRRDYLAALAMFGFVIILVTWAWVISEGSL